MTQNTSKSSKRASNWLIAFNVMFLLAAIIIIAKIVTLQYFWEPDPDFINHFRPDMKKITLEPERGAIMDHNGKLLAMSTPMYDIYMDCCVQKKANKENKDQEKGKKNEAEWIAKAKQLSRELPEVLKDDGRSADYYESLILTGRRKGQRYVSITKNIDHGVLLKLKSLTLFDEKPHKSGMIVVKKETRQYPYDELARRVIGYVKHNQDTTSKHIGVEGKYDYVLHGDKGYEWKTEADKGHMIVNIDSISVAANDGQDIRMTIDINIQDIADRALRKNMDLDEDIVGGCVVVLDVETAAVRAMVNLRRNKKGEFGEYFNMATGLPSEPGSVFKAVTLTTLLEDGHVGLDTEILTNGGQMLDMQKIPRDGYMIDYERETGRKKISVIEGFKRSSNYVFRRLAKDFYGDCPEEFINRIHEYNFGDAYQFELTENGSARPSIPNPKSAVWTMSDLVSSAIGYSVRVTPLQVATFYNAIANDGKMMRPYVVESLEKDGVVTKMFKPELLNGSICSKTTADTLTRALKAVALEGTAKRLHNAKCPVAGKTGTARMHLSKEEQNGSGKAYESADGCKKHQATFVGFFPADEPKYTAIVVVYTGLIRHNVYGGNIPVRTFKEIADELWAYDERWGDELEARGSVPAMNPDHISISKAKDVPVPDVKGFGLRDALYAIENNGYRCRHSGTGHVVSQSPKAGSRLEKGEVISIVLK